MGYIRHAAIIVTSQSDEAIEKAAELARETFWPDRVLGPCPGQVNHYRTMVVVPDGSKEGWGESNVDDERRELFISEIDKDPSLKWLQVRYGDSDPGVDRHDRAGDDDEPR